jgi:prevent-host-death family protein
MHVLCARRKYGYSYSHLPRRFDVTSYSVAEAKNRLPSLIDKALAGEEMIITRRGKPVVELRPASEDAVFDATGVRLRRAPPTPERLRPSLHDGIIANTARLRPALGGRAFAYPGHSPLAVTIRANSL